MQLKMSVSNAFISAEALKENTKAGTVALLKTDPENGVWEISFDVEKESRKQGLGTTLCKTVLNLVRRTGKENVRKIVAHTDHANAASIKLLSKLGFRESEEIWQQPLGETCGLIPQKWELPAD